MQVEVRTDTSNTGIAGARTIQPDIATARVDRKCSRLRRFPNVHLKFIIGDAVLKSNEMPCLLRRAVEFILTMGKCTNPLLPRAASFGISEAETWRWLEKIANANDYDVW